MIKFREKLFWNYFIHIKLIMVPMCFSCHLCFICSLSYSSKKKFPFRIIVNINHDLKLHFSLAVMLSWTQLWQNSVCYKLLYSHCICTSVTLKYFDSLTEWNYQMCIIFVQKNCLKHVLLYLLMFKFWFSYID